MDLKENKHIKNNVRHPWELARVEVINKLINSVSKNDKTSPKNIIDIGCGDALLINSIAGKHPNFCCYAIDTAMTEKQKIEFSSLYGNVNLFNDYNSLYNELQGEKIDLVLMLDVIEHIENADEFLATLINIPLFDSSTNFIVTVPAFASLFTTHDTFLGHYLRYTVRQLKETVRKCGSLEKSAGYFFFLLLIPRIIKKSFQKINKKNEIKSDLAEWNKGRMITSFIKYILLLDFKISYFLKRTGIRIPGLSVYIIFSK